MNFAVRDRLRLSGLFLIASKSVAAVFTVFGLIGCGEKYTEQGNLLGQKIDQYLVGKGICKDLHDCQKEIDMDEGHGNRVNFNIYAPKSREALAKIVQFVVTDGIEITGGVPISIQAYPRPNSDYVNRLLPGKTPVIQVKVKL